MSEEYAYVGGELELFAKARNWKAYWISKLRPYFGKNILEVGAGIGTNTLLLSPEHSAKWLCLEPDPNLAKLLTAQVAALPNRERFSVQIGDISALPPRATFDTILYIDVLEHIEDDGGELARVAKHVAPGGNLIVLSPAHQWLFSEFDKSIGHFRRYTTKMLKALNPPGLVLRKAFYLDAIGLFASLANRLLLKQSLPKPGQIALWDNYMVPASRLVDPLTGYGAGKTVIGIWTKLVE